jgi:reactive intermediate/imine deaminase
VIIPESLPLSAARRWGDCIYSSGQLPLDKEGAIVSGSIRDQTAQALLNLQAALESEGASLRDVLKVTVWLTDARLFAEFNETYSEFFSEPYPARSTVVARLLGPADIEIEAIARFTGSSAVQTHS